jgi:hypothetical protein
MRNLTIFGNGDQVVGLDAGFQSELPFPLNQTPAVKITITVGFSLALVAGLLCRLILVHGLTIISESAAT